MVLARGFGFADAIGDALMLVGYVRTIFVAADRKLTQ